MSSTDAAALVRVRRDDVTIVPMNPPDLLREARAVAQMSQRLLAEAAGTSRSTVAAYESGAMSPTVRQLDRLIEACGLQLRTTLEPRGIEVEQALEAALTGTARLDVESLLRFAASLEERGVQWAIDGATAVSLQGLAIEHHEPCLAVVYDETTQRWLRSVFAKGHDRQGFSLAPTWEEPAEVARVYVRFPIHVRHGYVRLRFLDEPPQAVPIVVDGRTLPVLPLLAVERAHPTLAELLALYRARGG